MKRKDELDARFIEYMESIGYDVPDEVNALDAIGMSIAHWKHNLRVVLNNTDDIVHGHRYCGLCQYCQTCSQCTLYKFEREHLIYEDTYERGCENEWATEDIHRMIAVLEAARDWAKGRSN
jgi:hypothetical protein